MWARLAACCSRLGFTWSRRRLAEESSRELETHIELLVDRYVRSGLSVEEARAAARRQLGNVTLVTEDIYQMNGIAWIDGLTQDLRYALRQLGRSPGFSAVVVLTLALGIGGTTAVFSVTAGVLLAPLPFAQPGQLVRFYQQEPDKPETRHYLTGTHFRWLRDSATSFESVAAVHNYSESGRDLFKDGQEIQLKSVSDAIAAGLAYVSEDRKAIGLNLLDDIKTSTVAAKLSKISKHGVLDEVAEYKAAESYRRELRTKTPSVDEGVSKLSGGNQQKVVLAKWMFTDPDLLILDEPTRGIDVGAKYEIYGIIQRLADQGKGVVVISSELPELIGLCDRIYTVFEGTITGEIAREDADPETLMKQMTSTKKMQTR